MSVRAAAPPAAIARSACRHIPSPSPLGSPWRRGLNSISLYICHSPVKARQMADPGYPTGRGNRYSQLTKAPQEFSLRLQHPAVCTLPCSDAPCESDDLNCAATDAVVGSSRRLLVNTGNDHLRRVDRHSCLSAAAAMQNQVESELVESSCQQAAGGGAQRGPAARPGRRGQARLLHTKVEGGGEGVLERLLHSWLAGWAQALVTGSAAPPRQSITACGSERLGGASCCRSGSAARTPALR